MNTRSKSLIAIVITLVLVLGGGSLLMARHVQVINQSASAINSGVGVGVAQAQTDLLPSDSEGDGLRDTQAPQSTTEAQPANSTHTSATVTSSTQTHSGARLIIPAIGVDANIQTVGLGKNSSIGIPNNFTDVAWYKGSVWPGNEGTAVIDGHLDGRTVAQAVFYHLEDLKPGDKVKVVKDGETKTFVVRAVKNYDYKSSPDDVLKSSDGESHLNLITCGGTWIKSEHMYDKRVVVFTDLES